MSKKDFRNGMEAGAKPFEEKFKRQADAIGRVADQVGEKLDDIKGIQDVILSDLSSMEKKRLYDLNTVIDISEMDQTEKEFLVSILFTLANEDNEPTDNQKMFIRSVKKYLNVTSVQADVDLSYIENIENINDQKAILQCIMKLDYLCKFNYGKFLSGNTHSYKNIIYSRDHFDNSFGPEELYYEWIDMLKPKAVQKATIPVRDVYVFSKHEYIFYVTLDSSMAIYKYNVLTGENDVLLDSTKCGIKHTIGTFRKVTRYDVVTRPQVVGRWLYFANEDSYRAYKISIDSTEGKSSELLLDGKPAFTNANAAYLAGITDYVCVSAT